MWNVPARPRATPRFPDTVSVERLIYVLEPVHGTPAEPAAEPDQPDPGCGPGRRGFDSRLTHRHLRGRGLVITLALGLACSGCSPPCRMRLSGRADTSGRGFRWWSIGSNSGLRSPIIGFEWDTFASESEQWLLSDSGARRFQYRGDRVIAAGPPTPTFSSSDGIDQVRKWLQYGLPPSARAVSREDAAGIRSMEDVRDLAERQWPDERTESPSGMTASAIKAEMEAFPHGVTQLLEVAGQF